jgi:ribonuclease HI
VELKNWTHPTDTAATIEVKEYDNHAVQIYTDGSKNEHGVGAGVAIFTGNELVTTQKFKLDNRCSNNQAEQLAIAKVLEALETMVMDENSPRTAAIITDIRISLDSKKNVNNHSYLIE